MIELTPEQINILQSLVSDHLKEVVDEYKRAQYKHAKFLTKYWAEQVSEIEALANTLDELYESICKSSDDAL
jgi:ferritin